MKKFIIFVIKWTLLIAYLVVVFSFVKKERTNTNNFTLNIDIIGDQNLIDTIEINKILQRNKIISKNINRDNINLNKIEDIIENISVVDYAEVYTDNYNRLNIVIDQKTPLIRVLTSATNSFYIDTKRSIIPQSNKYLSHVPIVSGYINTDFLKSINEDTPNEKLLKCNYTYTLKNVIDMMLYFSEHELWGSQIQQVFINKYKEIELVPLVGNHTIFLGDLNNYKEKMKKMEAMYKKGFKYKDINKYKTINLSFKDIVVCSK